MSVKPFAEIRTMMPALQVSWMNTQSPTVLNWS